MLALLSDLHANLHALDACLAHAQAQGADEFAFLGDLVGYGAHPGEVVARVMAYAARGAVVLQGNHDEAAIRPAPDGHTQMDRSAPWTHEHLDDTQRGFLASLPLVARQGNACFVHASAERPGAWLYVDHPMRAQGCLDAAQAEAPTRWVFCGHVHWQRLYFRGRGRGLLPFDPIPGPWIPVPSHRAWVATIGSVGQPRDGDPRAMYALFDAAQERIAFHRVSYDHRAAADAIRASGQPAAFATRLERGR